MNGAFYEGHTAERPFHFQGNAVEIGSKLYGHDVRETSIVTASDENGGLFLRPFYLLSLPLKLKVSPPSKELVVYRIFRMANSNCY